MSNKFREVGGLSRKTKFNIFIAVFLVFIIIAVLASLNQIINIVRAKEKILELEEKLNYERQKNIKLLAEEKSLYSLDAIELEARKQFNMAKSEETNYFIDLKNNENNGEENNNDKNKNVNNNKNKNVNNNIGGNSNILDDSLKTNNGYLLSTKYKDGDLWENLKIFYESEIKNK